MAYVKSCKPLRNVLEGLLRHLYLWSMDKLIRQAEAIKRVGVMRSTFWRWEKAGLIQRAATPRPGAWYHASDVDRFVCAERLQLCKEQRSAQ